MYQGVLINSENNDSFPVNIFLHTGFLAIHYVHEDQVFELNWNYDVIQTLQEDEANILLIENQNNPLQLNIQDNKEFITSFNQFKLKKNKIFSKFRAWKYRGLAIGIFLVLTLIIGALSFYLYTIPYLAEKIAQTIPKKYEIEIGENIYSGTVEVDNIDTLKSRLLNEFYQELHQKSDYPIKITYINDEVINAFALPGGHIIINKGIFDKLKNAESLVALLAHESSHVIEKHSTRTILKSLGGYALVSFLFGDVSGIIAIVAENANSIYNLSYSRELESEADNRGMDIMMEQQIDISGMVQLFETLLSQEKTQDQNTELLKFMSTHPLTKDRLNNAKKRLKSQSNAIPHLALDTLFNKLKNTP